MYTRILDHYSNNESYIPPYPINLEIINNVPTKSIAHIPDWIIKQAGVINGGQ
jgi:hypothetical protein